MAFHEQLAELEAQMPCTDPQSTRAMGPGRPHRLRPYRHFRAWLVLVLGTALLTVGVILGDGLLLAAGLVVIGLAGHLFDRNSAERNQPPPPRT